MLFSHLLLRTIGICLIFPQTKENHNEVILKAFLSLLPISLSLVNRLRCQQTSSSNHSFKGLLTISSILKVGYHFIWPYQVLFFSLWFVLDLQPRKCTLSFPSTKILLLFALNFFFSIFFLPYDSLPCSFYILFLRWYLSPLQPATFIDDKMEAYLFHPFETNKGTVKSDVKKKKPSLSFWHRFTAAFVNLLSSTFPGTDSFLVCFTGCCNMFPYTVSFPVVWEQVWDE